jgi:allantoicase
VSAAAPSTGSGAGDLGTGGPVDLAGRVLGATVVGCNDQFFADASNLIQPHPARFDPAAYDAKGKVYDGWETRRRRSPGTDWAVVRLAVPGVLERVDVDTAWFTGNYPPHASVEAACLAGFPRAEEVAALPEQAWTTLVPRGDLAGDTVTSFAVRDPHRWTHVRLTVDPDGGVARLRVWGRPVPDPALLTGTVDLLAAELGGTVVAASNEFYGTAAHLLRPGRAATMADGWENARRRDGGHDWVRFALGAPGRVRRVELDTSCFVGNAPGRVRLLGVDGRVDAQAPAGGAPEWRELLDLAPCPDTRHLLALEPSAAISHLLLEAHPDGGLSRLRLWGELDEAAIAAATDRWEATRP